jgi:hypothetical protein
MNVMVKERRPGAKWENEQIDVNVHIEGELTSRTIEYDQNVKI